MTGRARRPTTNRSRTVVPARPIVSRHRVYAVALCLALVFGLFGYRLVDLQLTPDPALAAGIGNRVRTVELAAPRGDILDRWGRTFALSLPAPTVVVDPRLVAEEQVPHLVARLEPLVSTPPEVLTRRLLSDAHFAYIDRQVDTEIGAEIDYLDLPGVRIEEEARREHPNGNCSGVAVVGRVDIDHIGISGLEESYNESLTGVSGQSVREASADGSLTIPGGEQVVKPARPGTDLRLTLDRNVQYQAEQILADAVDASGGSLGIAIVTVPSTGEIIAAANVLRDPETGLVGCTTTNLSAIWSYEPGSIVKPLTMSGVLEAGLTTPDETIALREVIEIPIEDGQVKRYVDWFAHEQSTYTPTEIITRSSNIGMITLAERLEAAGLYETLTSFGLGAQTALEFKGEASGILDRLDTHVLELSNVAIGQSVAVTGIQMLQAYNTIANGGLHVDPVLVMDDVGESTPRRVIREETADAVFAMMQSVVKKGTGTRAELPGYRVAGKTGTAWQPCDDAPGYLCADGGRHHTASFVGIVANDLGPQLSVIVIVDDPQGSTGGGAVAAPVFAEIAGYAVRQLRIPPASGADGGDRVRATAASALVQDEPSEEVGET